ncbi:MAG: hypothetical protein NVS1B7_4060 [Candidatus Saccharimonadales bacterium]
MEQNQQDARIAKGTQLLTRANQLTKFRSITSPYLGIATACLNESWMVCAADVAEITTDILDGHEARRGAHLLGTETTAEGATDDPKADKRFINAKLGGLGIRYLRQRDFTAASIVGVNLGISLYRDRKMEQDRSLVKLYNCNPEVLKASKINKSKMAIQTAGVIMLSSPLTREKSLRKRGLAILTVGTVFGLAGEAAYRRTVHRLIKKDLSAT